MEDVAFEPMADYCVVTLISRSKTAGGIALADGADFEPQQGLVVRAGPGRSTEEGAFLPNPIYVGDRVYLGGNRHNPAIELTLNGKQYVLVRARDIIGRVPTPRRNTIVPTMSNTELAS